MEAITYWDKEHVTLSQTTGIHLHVHISKCLNRKVLPACSITTGKKRLLIYKLQNKFKVEKFAGQKYFIWRHNYKWWFFTSTEIKNKSKNKIIAVRIQKSLVSFSTLNCCKFSMKTKVKLVGVNFALFCK